MVLPSKRFVQGLQKRTQQYIYTDVASILSYTVTGYDEYGQPTTTEVETEVRCSFTDKPDAETWASYADIEKIQAEIRFVGDMPHKGDKVELKSMYNRDGYETQAYADPTFEIVDIRDRDVFGYVCALKKVQI